MRYAVRFALLLIAALLLLTVSRAFSQPTNVCLPVAQAARIADSLQVLPLVRREAAAWQQAATGYRSAADSLATADAAHRAAYQQEQAATARLGLLLSSAEAVGAEWKAKSRKRGLLNVMLLAGLGGLGYFTITH